MMMIIITTVAIIFEQSLRPPQNMTTHFFRPGIELAHSPGLLQISFALFIPLTEYRA